MKNSMIKPKVLLLGKLPPPYIGPAIATNILLGSDLKHEFDLIHLDTSDHRDINTLGSIDFWNIFLAFKHYFLLMRRLVRKRPDLVYIPNGQTTISYYRDAVFILISKCFRRKIVCHLRGGNFRNWYDSSNSFNQYIVRKIHSLIDGQIILGDNLRKMFKGILPESKIFVIPNGASYNFLNNKNKQSNSVRILYLANFHKTKGVLDVLYSVPYVTQNHPNIEYIFAGNWRDEKTKEEFDDFVKNHKNIPISVLGPVVGGAKFELFSSSDIFVFPSYYPAEGHPWVIVEAMAAGLPIISTDQGAITESVIDGVNGFIVKKKSPNQIADKIDYLLVNPEFRQEMGLASRQHYLNHFTEVKMVEKISRCFKRVISES